MPINTEPSTFEFCRNWLLSSPTLIKDVLGFDLPEDGAIDDQTREEASARIYWQEVAIDQEIEPEDVEETEDEEEIPNVTPPPDHRPYVIVIPSEDSRALVGTGTYGGTGTLILAIEALVPAAYRANEADDTPATIITKHKGRREWSRQLCKTIRDELLETSGRGLNADSYLNARDVRVTVWPSDPEEGEPENYVGWMYEVPWR